MTAETERLAARLGASGGLSEEEYRRLIAAFEPETAAELARRAREAREPVYGRNVFLRGLIEISSYCKNDCLYCGLRRSNARCERYRLSPEQILACAAEGYALGFRTFVLQGGEDGWFTDGVLCPLIETLKTRWPDCAVTLSLGERSRESYARLRAAGADRYLLRHETADREHYRRLHAPEQSFDNRLRCLRDLRELGYQVGCGFMVGSPYQDTAALAKDLKLIETFRPDMCGIGPFIPHRDTPFGAEPAGGAALTCYLLSILRLMDPALLLPATTALATLDPLGREKGLASGANVLMPNLSPVDVRKKYLLYDNKACTGEEAAQCVNCLTARLRAAGYAPVVDRGDVRRAPAVSR